VFPKKNTITGKFFIVMILVYAICFTMTLFSLISLHRVKLTFERNNQIYSPAFAQAASLSLEIGALQMEFFRYLQGQTGGDQALKNYLTNMDARVARLLQIDLPASVLSEVAVVQARLQGLQARFTELQELQPKSNPEQLEKVAGGWLTESANLAGLISRIRDNLWDAIYAGDFRARALFIRDYIIFSLISSVLFVAASILVFKVQQDVKKGFALLRDGIAALARGERQILSDVTRQDEIGELARAFHELSQSLAAREEEAKQLQAQLLQAQKMEAVGTLAGGMAHDFNNILTAIQGHADLLLLDKNNDDGDYQQLQAIVQSAQRAAVLVRQLLTFSRKMPSNPLPVNLNKAIQEVVMLLGRTLPKMIDIKLHLEEPLKNIDADPVQLEQLLVNLAVNARDAMPEGGALIFATANVTWEAESRRHHMDLPPGEYVLLSVSDTGQGMSEEIKNHIFEPFFTTKEIGKGTGLGLAMVYGIVQSHHGDITCRSAPGAGTTFQIYLPVSADQTEFDSLKPSQSSFYPQGHEILLLVDDDDMLRNLGRQMLGRFGYEVLTAANGEEALDVYQRHPRGIDLVLLDLIMPGMGGAKCLAQLLRLDPRIKVVMISGYVPGDEINNALTAGACAFFSKPIDLKEMLLVVRQVLDGTYKSPPALIDVPPSTQHL